MSDALANRLSSARRLMSLRSWIAGLRDEAPAIRDNAVDAIDEALAALALSAPASPLQEPEAALRLALRALEDAQSMWVKSGDTGRRLEAMEAIRAALIAPSTDPLQEPAGPDDLRTNPDMVWLWTHCRAIGMTKKSDSGSMRDDIALFTITLKDALEGAIRLSTPVRQETAEPADEQDAKRYRWLREQDWFSGPLCVLRDPKLVLTRAGGLGADCPSRDRLDAAIDAAISGATS